MRNLKNKLIYLIILSTQLSFNSYAADTGEAASALVTGVLNIKTKPTPKKPVQIKIIVNCKSASGIASVIKGKKIDWKLYIKSKLVKQGSSYTNDSGFFELDILPNKENEFELEYQKVIQKKVIDKENLTFEYPC